MKSEFTPLCLDAPGHGNNTNGVRSLPQCADDIAAAMQPGILVGYSMGARMALHVALRHPTMVAQLVLISGTPGLVTEAERTARRKSDNDLAERIETIGLLPHEGDDPFHALHFDPGGDVDHDERRGIDVSLADGDEAGAAAH